MRFKYGSWAAETGEFSLRSFTKTGSRNEKGRLEKVTVALDVEFEIIRDTQATITSRYNQIMSAITRDGRDVGFYLDSGAPSAIHIDHSETSSGVLITQYPSLSPVDGADYATHHKGSCSFMATYLPSAFGGGSGQGQSQLTDYRETLSVRGTGGPRREVVESDRGAPLEYILCDRTPIYAQQSGGLSIIAERPVYPMPNMPVWPALLVNEGAEHTKELTPESDGSYRMSVSWNYQFISLGPLFGEPRVR